MDSITRAEFHKIFKRVSETTNLKGCKNPENIEERLKRNKKHLKTARDLHVSKKSRANLTKKIRGIDRLLKNGRPTFSQQVFIEAAEHPLGIVNMTLLHGKKAQDIMLARKKVRLRVRRESAARRYEKTHRRE